ncbi:MAG: ATP-binding protein [Paludibacteraceae bacterium]|nr:ATP-binding protein [Paludibacteraceae bacterium]
MAIKLIDACKVLNIGMSTAIMFCNMQGREIPADPDIQIIDDDLFLLLAKEYNKDFAIKLEMKKKLHQKVNETQPLYVTETLGFDYFRRFKELSPISFDKITFLVGANNAGKSTFFKGLLLVDYNLPRFINGNFLPDEMLFRFDVNNVHIGTFKNALYNNLKQKSSTITFKGHIQVNLGENIVRYELDIVQSNEMGTGKISKLRLYLSDWYCITIDAIQGKLNVKYDMPEDLQYQLKQLINSPLSDEWRYRYQWRNVSPLLMDAVIPDATTRNSLLKQPKNIETLLNSPHGKFKMKFVDAKCNDLKSWIEQVIGRDCGKLNHDYERVAFIASSLLGFKSFLIQPSRVEYIEAHSAPQNRWFTEQDTCQLSKVIREFVQLDISKDNSESEKAISFLHHWLQEFQIADDYEIKSNDGEIYCMNLLRDGQYSSIANLGRGSIQLVTLFMSIALLIYKKQNAIVLIEEPEQNLHPSFQSKLVYVFKEASEYGIRFIIETHSEYLIRNSQVLVAELKCSTMEDLKEKNTLKTYYFPNDEQPPYEMIYRTDGLFANKFGSSFYKESTLLLSQLF